MRLNVFRRRATAVQLPAPPATRGVSGTINYRGFFQTDEYNNDLRYPENLRVYDQMQRSDGSVQEAVDHIFAPVKNATVTVEPPKNPSDDELVACALVRDSFFETLQQPFVEYVDQALAYLTDGHAIFEPSWQIVERELSYDQPGVFDVDPDTGRRAPRTVTVPSRQWLVWDRLEQRLPRTVWKWNTSHGKLVSLVQSAYDIDTGRYDYLEIQGDQLLVLTNKRRGDDFTGRSILRSAYKPWYLKELVEKIEVVALERWGVGVAVAYPPRSKADDAAYIARLEDILANLRAGESTYIVATAPKQGSGQNGEEGVLFEILSPTGTPPDFKSPKEYHRAEIKAAVLARFAELGHAQTGARSTGDTQSKVWYDALHAVARYLEDAHQPLIRQLVDYNLPGIQRYPKLGFSGIEARDLAEFAQAQSQLVASGAITPDATYHDWVREQVDGPPADEQEQPEPDPTLTEPADQNALTPAEQRRRRALPAGQQQLPIAGGDQ